jgi:hypothetical protein
MHNDLLKKGCDCKAGGKRGDAWYVLIALGIVMLSISMMLAIATLGVS